MAHWKFTAHARFTINAADPAEFYPVSGLVFQNLVEAEAQVRARAPYIFKNLYITVSANSLTAATTVDFRNGGVGGNQSVSIPGGGTGRFEEDLNPSVVDNVASGDLINTQFLAGATGTSITLFSFAYDVEHATGRQTIVVAAGQGVAVHDTTRFPAVSGASTVTAGGEGAVQYRLRVAADFRNMRIFISNKTTGNGTLTFRVNGAAGNQTISITGTGEFEDTTNTDSLVSGDLWSYEVVAGTGHGGQNQVHQIIHCEMEATGLDDDGNPMGARITACGHPGANQAFGISGFLGWCTIPLSIGIAEVDAQVVIRDPQDAVNYFVRVTIYSLDVAADCFLRVDAADSLLGVSLNGTGEFEDTADRIVLADGDLCNYSLDTSGASSGSIDVSYVGHEARQPLAGGEELAAPQGINRVTAVRAY